MFGDDITITTDNNGNKTKLYNVFLEYAQGGCLADFMDVTILSETKVRQYTKSILRGLECVHKKGIVHCDLKPENILMVKEEDDDEDFVAKISDFGLSKKMSDDWMTPGIVKGTKVYWAPECVEDEIQEQCSDIWALDGSIRWNNKINETMSKDAKDFLVKCFEANPLERPSATMLLSHPFVVGGSFSDGPDGSFFPVSLSILFFSSLSQRIQCGETELGWTSFYGLGWQRLRPPYSKDGPGELITSPLPSRAPVFGSTATEPMTIKSTFSFSSNPIGRPCLATPTEVQASLMRLKRRRNWGYGGGRVVGSERNSGTPLNPKFSYE
ncbi:hypothetical protein F8388_000387 [Cannabis sativa]|uniref:Protein kinase domain-containing protein n=1 Tax=Cannabis sativa TaxID=3483 RepID=A0A7J6DYR6_CANSA|nr:hypothetical protein F8388_000387 [Cannabis sativa]